MTMTHFAPKQSQNGVLCLFTSKFQTSTIGYYSDRGKAVHWDGRNDLGESVASGVYFYHLTAGDFSATRKMLIMK